MKLPPLLARKRAPTHPGQVLSENLEALRLSARAAAAGLGVSNTLLSNIIACKAPLTSDMALRIDRFLGTGDPQMWMGLQTDYDLWHAAQRLKTALAAIVPVKPER